MGHVMGQGLARVSSLADFVRILNEFTDTDELLFRGHRCSSWRLNPSLSRLRLRAQATLPTAEQSMLTRFKREAVPHLRFQPQDDWDWLSVAQHHGLATRLLDWTGMP